jgi:multicomponent Na+:H+ antiporter subunit D
MLVLQAAVDSNRWWVVALMFMGGALSFVYMFQLYRARFWVNQEADEATTRGALGLMLGIALTLVVIGVYPQPLLAITARAAESLLGVSP